MKKDDKRKDLPQVFKPGESGNPMGRPKGGKNKTTILKAALEEAMVTQVQEDVLAILKKATSMAKKGDRAMIKFVLERFLPKAGTREEDDNKGIGGINIIVQGIEPAGVTIEQNKEGNENQS